MIDRKKLLNNLKPLLKELEADLRARCDEVSEIDAGLKQEYQQAKDAGRTGAAFEAWRADLITQVAAAWVLSCVFVRFLEDSELISPPRISGPLHGAGEGRGMMRSRDERDLYFRSHPTDTDRDYLLAVFDDLVKLPGAKDIFGPHNPVNAYRDWLSGDAAQKLIEFFQRIDKDETGELIHDFTDPVTPTRGWDTRFLGDLYQDLSETARKKYALLQTPVFVEEFILERTLEPAINEFGLEGFKMIDPACGSGHFLLGAFTRALAHWRRNEPGTPDRELINRALAAVHGVDLNPYAVAIARFRLLIAAMRESQVTRLKDAPAFQFNLVCGDSLLHGGPGGEQQHLGFHELAHAYESEDLAELRRILTPGAYHAVVANPPYITVKDKALNEAYRERYTTCHRQYSLAVPFFERLFGLARLADGAGAGFVGQITANSFMKREFGKKLIEAFLPRWDLTHVVDTQLAYIPEHGTATAIIFARHRQPTTSTVRLLSGLRREDNEPKPPESGKVWQAILAQADLPGSQSEFVSVSDTNRESFHKHPWSIGGGGAAELKEHIDRATESALGDYVVAIGRGMHTGCDESYFARCGSWDRCRIESTVPVAEGDTIREWQLRPETETVFPYHTTLQPITDTIESETIRLLWTTKRFLVRRREPNGTHAEIGLTWYEWSRFQRERFTTPLSIAFAFVATHNHFVLDRGGKVFTRSAPVIKLQPNATEDDHLALLGLLNSSTACFWMKQIFYDKGGGGISEGVKAERWERFFEHDGTKIKKLPVSWAPAEDGRVQNEGFAGAIANVARDLDAFAQSRAQRLPSAILGNTARKGSSVAPEGWSATFDGLRSAAHTSNAGFDRPGADSTARSAGATCCHPVPMRADLDAARAAAEQILQQMIARQEEIDWLVYRAYGLLDDSAAESAAPPPIALGQRAFEIVMARKIERGELQTEWFRRHGSTPITRIPGHWPVDYQRVVERRITLIEAGPTQRKDIALIEQPEYKRRWNVGSWEEMEQQSLRGWSLDRLERYFDLDGRMDDEKQITAHATLREPRLTSVAQVADLARKDAQFMQVAEVYVGRMDFDITNLVGELITAESVPALPVLRYKPSGLDKRVAWERTWDLQRLEDAVDALFEVDRLKELAEAAKQGGDAPTKAAAALPIEESARRLVAHELRKAAGYVAEAVKQKLNLASDTIIKPLQDAAERAKKAAVGDIPVPPKYKRADFLDSKVWRLRGKLDVPKERWVCFPHCEGEDSTLVIAWAGYDHLQLARAIAERYELAKEQEGRKLVPLLAAIGQLIPWLKQWHNDLDPAFGTRMGDYFENYLAEEAKAIGKTVAEVMAWTPPAKATKRGRKRANA